MKLEIIQKKEYLIFLVSRQYDMKHAIGLFDWVLQSCKMTGLNKVLIDFRMVDGNITATERIIYSTETVAKYKSFLQSEDNVIHLAYLGKAPNVSTYEPGYDIVKREDLPVLLTADLSEAMSWLGVKD